MNPFHRYPQHPDAYPDRPWWRLAGEHWHCIHTPVDELGKHILPGDASEEDLAAHDRDHPMPVPEPRCGQVWSRPDRDFLIDVVSFDFDRVTAYSACWGEWPPGSWPPLNAVLLHGPGAPWAPPDWETP